jgi:gas vesicle protein
MSTDSSFSTEDSFDRPNRTDAGFEAESEKSPETLEREIDARRANITSIVDALESKLSPGQLVDQALAYSRRNGGEFFGNLGSTVRANPVPTVLTGIGLLWLMTSQHRPASSSSGPSLFDGLGASVSGMAESVTDTFGNAKARVEETARRMKDKASQVGDKAHDYSENVSGFGESVGDKVSAAGRRLNESGHEMGDGIRRQGEHLQSSLSYLLKEQPLALAAIGIALGAAIGAALPATAKENQLMGHASDRLTQKAKTMATDGYAKATEVGKSFVEDVKTTVSQPGTVKPDAGQQASSGATPGV